MHLSHLSHHCLRPSRGPTYHIVVRIEHSISNTITCIDTRGVLGQCVRNVYEGLHLPFLTEILDCGHIDVETAKLRRLRRVKIYTNGGILVLARGEGNETAEDGLESP
jgi:hypothetical protein